MAADGLLQGKSPTRHPEEAVSQLFLLDVECMILHFGTAYFMQMYPKNCFQYTFSPSVTQPAKGAQFEQSSNVHIKQGFMLHPPPRLRHYLPRLK